MFQLKPLTPICTNWTWTPEIVDPCNGIGDSRLIPIGIETRTCPNVATGDSELQRKYNHSVQFLYDIGKTSNRSVAEKECQNKNLHLFSGFELVGFGNWDATVLPSKNCTYFWTAFIMNWESFQAKVPEKHIWISLNCSAELWNENEVDQHNADGKEKDLVFFDGTGKLFIASSGFEEAFVACDLWELIDSKTSPNIWVE